MKPTLLLLLIILINSVAIADDADDDCPSASVDDSLVNPLVQNQGSLGSCGAYTMAQMADAWSAAENPAKKIELSTNPTSGLLVTLLTYNHGNAIGSRYRDINGPSIAQTFDAITSRNRDFSCSAERTDELILQYARARGVNVSSASSLTTLFAQANVYYRELYQRYADRLTHSQMMNSYEEMSNEKFLRTLNNAAEAMCRQVAGSPSMGINISDFGFIKELFFLDGQDKLLAYIKDNCGPHGRKILGETKPKLNRFDQSNGQNSRSDHIKAFNTAFTQTPIQPVAIGYCLSILKSRRTLKMDHRTYSNEITEDLTTGKCEPHWGVVSAQLKSWSGRCMVRIRSTHGTSCAPYARHLGCDSGHVWIPRSTLLNNMDEAYFFSR
jgi:hypothetical protein